MLSDEGRHQTNASSRNENDQMMCGKTLRDGIPNGLLRDKTGVEDIENHLGKTRLRWLRHLRKMNGT